MSKAVRFITNTLVDLQICIVHIIQTCQYLSFWEIEIHCPIFFVFYFFALNQVQVIANITKTLIDIYHSYNPNLLILVISEIRNSFSYLFCVYSFALNQVQVIANITKTLIDMYRSYNPNLPIFVISGYRNSLTYLFCVISGNRHSLSYLFLCFILLP